MRSRRSRSGYIRAATLAILFVLFVLAMAMQYMGSRARQSYMLQEADFQAEQAVENQLVIDEARMQGVNIPVAPAGTDMYLKKYDGWSGELMIGPTTELFGKGPAPAFFGRPQDEAPEGKAWHAYAEWSPRSMRADLNSFGRSRVVASYSAGFPYAVFAPQGTIQLTQALPYGDPPSSKPSDQLNGLQDFTSGLQVKLAAGEGVNVTDAFPYGEAYTKSGRMALKGSGALGFYGQVPMDGYASRLTSDINQAMRATR